MSRTNERRRIEWHETCKRKCRLDASVCNNKQHWNDDKCRCEWKELIDKGVCDKGSIWNPSNCECECDKSCDVGEYIDYQNCKCRKKLFDKLFEQCTENIDEVKIAEITVTENIYKCSSYTLHIVLLLTSLQSTLELLIVFFYYRYMNQKTATIYDYVYQATNY